MEMGIEMENCKCKTKPTRDAFLITLYTQILYCLRDQPAAIASYLTGVKINRYTTELMRCVLDHLDFSLPGEEGRWWRTQLWSETPKLSLRKDAKDRYRGPLFHEKRRINGKTVVASVKAGSRGDLRIQIDKGTHGVLHSRYRGRVRWRRSVVYAAGHTRTLSNGTRRRRACCFG